MKHRVLFFLIFLNFYNLKAVKNLQDYPIIKDFLTTILFYCEEIEIKFEEFNLEDIVEFLLPSYKDQKEYPINNPECSPRTKSHFQLLRKGLIKYNVLSIFLYQIKIDFYNATQKILCAIGKDAEALRQNCQYLLELRQLFEPEILQQIYLFTLPIKNESPMASVVSLAAITLHHLIYVSSPQINNCLHQYLATEQPSHEIEELFSPTEIVQNKPILSLRDSLCQYSKIIQGQSLSNSLPSSTNMKAAKPSKFRSKSLPVTKKDFRTCPQNPQTFGSISC